MGLLTPNASAQMFFPSGFNSMHSMRPSGMPILPHLNPSLYPGGFGLNPNMSILMGLNRYPMSPYAMFPVGPVGNYMVPTGTAYGYQPSRMNATSQLPSSGDGYASISASKDEKSTLRTTGNTQLKSLRQFAGGLSWPRALFYFTSDGKLKELREGIDSKVEALVAQEDGKPVAADTLEGLKKDVEDLRKRFIAQSYDLAMTSQQETDARRFLGKLKSALEGFPTAPASSARQ
jgi:hypothetical protein